MYGEKGGGTVRNPDQPINCAAHGGWLWRVRDDCPAAGIPVFVKELGSRPFDGETSLRPKDFAGRVWGEWPADLRVRGSWP